MVSNPILRANARKQLGDKIFSNTWLMMVLVCFIQGALISAASSLVAGVGGILITGILSYGVARIMLLLIRGKETIDLSDLFCCFKSDWPQTVILGILQSLFIALWSLLFIIPGMIKSYAYALAFYIQQDQDDKSWKYCLDKSQEMMNGYKMQLFLLDLSFVPWYIIGGLCFGIGALFVTPYHYMARANFYEALRASYDA